MINKNVFSKLLILSLVLAFAIVGCTPTTPSGDGGEDDKYGGTAVFRILGEPTSLVAHGATDSIAGLTGMLLHEPLMRLNVNNEWEKRLAEDWTVSDDGLVYTFTIRENAKWHDGEPITADDAVFAHELVMNPDAQLTNRPNQFVNGKPIKYEKVDDRTFNVILPEKFAPVFSYLVTPMPKHIWEDVPASDYLTSTVGQNPVGSGPFKFVEYKASDRIVFEAFEDYYEGRPYLDKIIYSIIPDNNAAAIALETGQIDFADVPGDVFQKWENSDSIQTYKAPSGNVQFLALNNEVFPFNDAKVRKALSHLTNKAAIIEQAMLGFAQEAHNFMVPSDLYYDENAVTKYTYDIEKAKALLEEAGFEAGSDGILAKDGKRMEFEMIIHSGNVQREQAGLIMQSDFAKAGIKVNLKALEWSAVIALLNRVDGVYPYDCLLIGNTLGPDPTRYAGVYHSKSDPYMAFSNEDVDMLFDAGDVEIDFDARGEIYTNLQSTMTDAAPVIWLWYAETLYGYTPRLQIDEAEVTGLAHLRFLKPHKLYVKS